MTLPFPGWLEFLQERQDVVCVFVPRSAHPAQPDWEQERVRRLVRYGTAQLAQGEPARVRVRLHHMSENAEGERRSTNPEIGQDDGQKKESTLCNKIRKILKR